MRYVQAVLLIAMCGCNGCAAQASPVRKVEVGLPALVGRHVYDRQKIGAFEIPAGELSGNVRSISLRMRGVGKPGTQMCCSANRDTLPKYYQFMAILTNAGDERWWMATLVVNQSGSFEISVPFESAAPQGAIEFLSGTGDSLRVTSGYQLTACCDDGPTMPEATVTDAALVLELAQ